MNKLQAGCVRPVPPERAGCVLQQDQVLEDADPQCGWQAAKNCMDYSAWQQAWTEITG